MTGPQRQTGSARKHAVVFFTMLLALRLFWVPLHLALEPHDGDSWASHVLEYLHDEHSPSERHGDENHPSHPSADHRTELLASRIATDVGSALFVHSEPCSVVLPKGVVGVVHPRRVDAPKPPPPRACRARSPPSVS